jgi:hypothetical protein
MRLSTLFLCLLPLVVTACGDKDDEAAECTGGTEIADATCTAEDSSACVVTCICADGELPTDGCLSGSCSSVEVVCGTGCPNFGLGDWTGDWCNE